MDLIILPALAGLMIYVIYHDLRYMLIPALPVLALAGLGIAIGIFEPLPGLRWQEALLSVLIASLLCITVRGYARWRFGIPAFGGADIAVILGGSSMLGPFLLGPWVIGAAILAIILSFTLPKILGTRATDYDGEYLSALPFCPALIIGWAVCYAALRSDYIRPEGFL